MCLADFKAGIGWESFSLGDKKEDFTYALIGGYWHGEAGGGLTESWASYVIGSRRLFNFLLV